MRGLARPFWPSNRATRVCNLSPLYSSSSPALSSSSSFSSSSPAALPSTSASSPPFSPSSSFTVKNVPFQPTAPNGHTSSHSDASFQLEHNINNTTSDNIDNNTIYNNSNNLTYNNTDTENNGDNTITNNNVNGASTSHESETETLATNNYNDTFHNNNNKIDPDKPLSPDAEERRAKALHYLDLLENMKINKKHVNILNLLNAPNLTINQIERVMIAGRMYDSVGINEYGTYLTLSSKRGELHRVLAVFQEMEAQKIKPDAKSLNALMHACSTNNKLDVMYTLARTRTSEWDSDHRSDPFGVIILHLLQKGDILQGEKVFNEVIERGLKIDACVANPLLSFYSKKLQPQIDESGRKTHTFESEGEEETREKVEAILKKMRESGGVMNASTYYYRMLAVRRGEEEKEGTEILDEALANGIKLEPKTYNSFINTLILSGHTESATKVLVRMGAEDVLPDNATYSILINAFVKVRSLSALQSMVPLITRPEGKPSIWVYSNLVDALYKLGDMDTSNAVLGHMTQIGLRADVYTYNALLFRYHRTNNRQMCVSIFEEMRKSDVLPDRATYDIMFHAYASMGNLEKSKEMFDALIAAGKPQANVFFSMARLFLHDNDHGSCISVLSLARSHYAHQISQFGPTITRIELLAHAGARNYDGVKKAFLEAKEDGGQITLAALVAYMATSLRAGVDVCEECLAESKRLSLTFKPWHYTTMLEFLSKEAKWDTYNIIAADYKSNYKNSSDYKEPDKEVETAKLSRIILPRKPFKSTKKPTSPSPSSHVSSPHSPSSPPPTPSPSIVSSSSPSLPPDSLPQDTAKPSPAKNRNNKPRKAPSSSPPPPFPNSSMIPDFTQFQFGLFQQHFVPFQQYLSHLQQQQFQMQHHQAQQQQTQQLHSIFLQQPDTPQHNKLLQEKEKEKEKERTPITLAKLQVQAQQSKLVGTAYNILLHDACLRGDLTLLGYILYYMAHAGVKLDAQAYSGILSAALNYGDDALGSKVLTNMEAQGITADTHMYNMILASWSDKGEHTKVEALLQHMKLSSVSHDDTTRQIVAQIEERKQNMKNDKKEEAQ